MLYLCYHPGKIPDFSSVPKVLLCDVTCGMYGCIRFSMPRNGHSYCSFEEDVSVTPYILSGLDFHAFFAEYSSTECDLGTFCLTLSAVEY